MHHSIYIIFFCSLISSGSLFSPLNIKNVILTHNSVVFSCNSDLYSRKSEFLEKKSVLRDFNYEFMCLKLAIARYKLAIRKKV